MQKKLTNVVAQQQGSLLYQIFKSLPKPEDTLWTKQLVQLPRVTFITIYGFLVDRKVILPKVKVLLIYEQESQFRMTWKMAVFCHVMKFLAYQLSIA